jgi:AAA-like domain
MNYPGKLERLRITLKKLQQAWSQGNSRLRTLRQTLETVNHADNRLALEQQLQREEARLKTVQKDLDHIESEINCITQTLAPSSSPCAYHTVGPLSANDPTYVERPADQMLFNQLRAGKFCYIFNPPQTGKSSLRERTTALLEVEEIACVTILPILVVAEDFTEAGWYKGVISQIVMDLNLTQQFDLVGWWKRQERRSGVEQFQAFIEEQLLPRVPGKIVILIDSIERILSLRFNITNFFTVIEDCHRQRDADPDYQRLTFALFGTITPTDLIHDPARTPVNGDQFIALTDFTQQETFSLDKGLERFSHPQAILEAIWQWTKGQPFLTQKLCSLVQASPDHIPTGHEQEYIKSLVEELIQGRDGQDVHAHLTAIDTLIRTDLHSQSLLDQYAKLLDGESIVADRSPEQIKLCLSGLAVVTPTQQLAIRNPLYERFFNSTWLNINAKTSVTSPYAEAINAWVNSDYKNQSYLLYGKPLENALKWSEGLLLNQTESRFFAESRNLAQAVQFLPNPRLQAEALHQVMTWTGGNQALNQSLFPLLFTERKRFQGNVKIWIEQVIQTGIIEPWQTAPAAAPLRRLQAQLLACKTCDPFWLLMLYQKVLLLEELTLDHPQAQIDLTEMGLLVQSEGILIVANLIYAHVFDLIWVNHTLEQLRPYAKKFSIWLDSEGQDKSQLLSKTELTTAQIWAIDKNLNELEHQFLIDSMIWHT